MDIDYPLEFDFAGEGAFWMHNVLSKGSLVQTIICVKCDAEEARNDWKKTITSEEIKHIYRNWPAPIPKALDEVCFQWTYGMI